MTNAFEDIDLCGRRRFLAEWRRAKLGAQTPRRSDLRIENFFPYLGQVSILQRCEDGFEVRLSGAVLREILRKDPRGARLADIDACADAAAWTSAIADAAALELPQSGECIDAEGRVHIWVRAPMSSDGVTVDMVLCYDQLVGEEDLLSNRSNIGGGRVGALDKAA